MYIFFSVFDHFLHLPGPSYGSFTTSHKSSFLWIPWNQPVNTLCFLLSSISLTTSLFNVFPLAEHTFIPLCLFPPGVCLASLEGFLFWDQQIQIPSRMKAVLIFYFISTCFLWGSSKHFKMAFTSSSPQSK